MIKNSLIERISKEGVSLHPAEIQDLFQLSPYQAQLFRATEACMLHRWQLDPATELVGLARSFDDLAAEQPVLRTGYLCQAGRPVQRVARRAQLELHCISLGALAPFSRYLAILERAALTAVQRRLNQGLVPIQFVVVCVTGTRYLLLGYHPVALDEFSRGALLSRWWTLMSAAQGGTPIEPSQLPNLRPTFKQWPGAVAAATVLATLPNHHGSPSVRGSRTLRRHLPLPALTHQVEQDLVRAALWGLLLARFTQQSRLAFLVLTPPAPGVPLGQRLRPRLLEIQLTAQTRFVDLLHQLVAPWADPPAALPKPSKIALLVGDLMSAEEVFPEHAHRHIGTSPHALQASWCGDDMQLRYEPQISPTAQAMALLDGLGRLVEGLRRVPDARLCYIPLGVPPVLSRSEPPPAIDPALRFLALAGARADRPAMYHRGAWLSYGALREKVLALAALLRLRSADLAPGALVALAFGDPVRHLQALLACLCAGLPFLPLDVRQPAQHLATTLAHTGARLLLCDRNLDTDLPQIRPEALLAAAPIEPEPSHFDPDTPAYMIPTSGTTGQPKGVLLRRGGLANTLSWRVSAYAMGEGDRALQVFAPNFDGYLTSALTPLLSGAALVLPENPADPAELQVLLRTQRPTHLLITPSHLTALLALLDADDLGSVRTLTLAGEKVEASLLAHPALAKLDIFNEYGPTENSIASTWHGPCRPRDPVPIGKPIPGCIVEVVDRWGNLQPPFAVGELILSGEGLAYGYQSDPARTAAAFRPHLTAGRCYHSGDLGYLDRKGRLIYLRRRDQQRKLSGYRVEPAELARIIERHPAVEAADVAVAEDASGPHLVAHYRGAVDPESLRGWLGTQAPSWLLPRHLRQA